MSKDLKDKKILITGASGFVGKKLFDSLQKIGAEVYGISRHPGKSILQTDVLDFKALDKIISNKKIDICYHLAGESLVESGQSDPYSTFKTNIDGTINVLELGRKYELQRVIIASTSHVYGKNEVPYQENFTPKPSRPYETSKACTDLIAQSYADSFGLPVLIPRFVNIYGPGDLNFTRLIPKTIKQILTEKEVVFWGGNAIRDFLYIDDAIKGYVDLGTIDISSIDDNRIFNFGGGNTISVKDLIEKIVEISGMDLKISKSDNAREDEIKEQYVSFAKAKRILGWEPKISLSEGLRQTISWYKEYFSHTDSA